MLSALADPTRRAIVARLARGEATVSELAAPFAISQPAVSRHLKVLRDAGLVEEGREAQYRPRRLRPEALREVSDWLEQYRKLWDDRMDRLEEYLKDLQKSEKRAARSEKRRGRRR
jgi:DNA-binding transcriptional ArsR family regulator